MQKLNSRRNKRKKKTDNFETIENIVLQEKEMQNLSHITIMNYQKVFNSLKTFFYDCDNPMNITTPEAKEYIKYLKYEHVHYRDKLREKNEQRGLKPSTINTYIKVCKTIYQTLVDLEYIESNPFAKIKCLKRQNERIKTIPPQDINKLLNSLENAYYTDFRMFVTVHVLLDTFGRIDEVLHIKKSDIDFEKRTIYFGKTKNNEGRYVVFSNKTKKLIQELIDETREYNNDYLFLSVEGTRFTNDAFRNQLKKYCKEFEIPTNITPHMFRHTASMLFLENGGNIRVLQKILGHKKLATTEVYAHVSEDLLVIQQENYSPLEQVLGKQKKYVRPRNKRLK
ncbi:tyrosine-type recombinase/integrase [Staphylococcus pseudintermedius]|nr:tyrosine-type recombinase/integrase [Staphylococcus pseudintermedius]